MGPHIISIANDGLVGAMSLSELHFDLKEKTFMLSTSILSPWAMAFDVSGIVKPLKLNYYTAAKIKEISIE